MKIEICEQMVQSWLQHCKQCELVQTNWTISPLRLRSITDLEIAELEKFMKEFEEQLNQILEDETKAILQESVDEDLTEDENETKKKTTKGKKLNIFKKNKAGQFIRQCEIDVVGCKLDNGITERIYLVDTAFHKTGLGYHDAVATVVKKIVRAVVVAVLIFGEHVPVTVAFVSPKCGIELKTKIETVVARLRKILALHSCYDDIDVELYFNEDFTSDIYLPLISEIDELNNDNDLFMRAMNLAKLAEEYRVISSTAVSAVSKPAASFTVKRNPKGYNQKIVFGILDSIISSGKMTPALLKDLKSHSFAKNTFKLPTYPVLISVFDFKVSGYDDCRFYEPTITIDGEEYRVCSQWIPERIYKLENWHRTL